MTCISLSSFPTSIADIINWSQNFCFIEFGCGFRILLNTVFLVPTSNLFIKSDLVLHSAWFSSVPPVWKALTAQFRCWSELSVGLVNAGSNSVGISWVRNSSLLAIPFPPGDADPTGLGTTLWGTRQWGQHLSCGWQLLCSTVQRESCSNSDESDGQGGWEDCCTEVVSVFLHFPTHWVRFWSWNHAS